MDLAAQRASLDAIYGPTSGDLDVELWVGDPLGGGTEVTGDGYAPGSLPDTGWNAADTEGVKSSTSTVDCGTPTDEWSGTVTHFLLRGTGGVSWGSFPLASPLDVGDAGPAVLVRPSVFFGDTDNN